jgi:hypothetical protein
MYIWGYKLAIACTTLTIVLILNAGIILIKEMGDLAFELQDSVTRSLEESEAGKYIGFLGCRKMSLMQRKRILNLIVIIFAVSASISTLTLGSINTSSISYDNLLIANSA